MSYLFSVRGTTKAEAREKVALELAGVITNQPLHQADADQASAAASAFINLLIDDEARDIVVSVHGSIRVTDTGPIEASCGISASLQPRELKI
jgi:hypothetical protein